MEKTVYRLKKHENGLIAVEQHRIGELDLTYNPDDEKFYVYRGEDVVAVIREYRNAVYYCKRRMNK